MVVLSTCLVWVNSLLIVCIYCELFQCQFVCGVLRLNDRFLILLFKRFYLCVRLLLFIKCQYMKLFVQFSMIAFKQLVCALIVVTCKLFNYCDLTC